MRARAAALLLVAAACAVSVGSASARSPRIELRWIQMIDLSRGYALSGQDASAYRLLWTDDGGRRWSDVTPGNGKIHPSGPLSIVGRTRLFSTQLRRGVYAVERSDDGGATWTRSVPFRDPHGQGAGRPLAIDRRHLVVAVDEGAAAGSQAEALFASTDGGRRWRLRSRTAVEHAKPTSLPFGCDKSGFGFATPSRGWAGGYCAGGFPFFYRTDDGGRTWRRQALPVSRACACETTAPVFSTPALGATAVSGFTTNGAGSPIVSVLWTSDGGRHWRGSSPPAGRVGVIRFVDARTAWLIGQRRGDLRGPSHLLIRTSDAGRHWSTATAAFDLSSYQLDPLSATVAYAWKLAWSKASPLSNAIRVTRDGGRTWQTIHATATGG